MQNFDIVKEIKFNPTFRNQSIVGKFDLSSQNYLERFSGEIDIKNKKWNVGLIVGNSGTGKTTIAKQVFGNDIIESYPFLEKNSIIDDMPKDKSINEICTVFNKIGFSSPPSWLKPYHVLSNGEKMRVELAYNILSDKQMICFDEFTSVVDRNVAKIVSTCIAKTIRKLNKNFVAISCHDDVIEWLEPDWIFDTNKMEFFFIQKKQDSKGQRLTFLSTNVTEEFGKPLVNIII